MFSTARGRTIAWACGAAIPATLILTPVAMATPGPSASSSVVLDLYCADGTSYTLSVPEKSHHWSAGTDLATGATLIPVYFGNIDVKLYSADGQDLIDQTLIEQHDAKGRSEVGLAGEVKDCEFTVSGVEELPDLGEVLVSVNLQVDVVVARP